jgi:hypothetical protein
MCARGRGQGDGLPGRHASGCSVARCTPVGTERLGFSIVAVQRRRSEAQGAAEWSDHSAAREGTRRLLAVGAEVGSAVARREGDWSTQRWEIGQ